MKEVTMRPLAWALLLPSLLLPACPGNPCDDKSGSVTCGYCAEDVILSSNPHAGMCRYCSSGSSCQGEVCGDLSCVTAGGGGGGGLNCYCPQYSTASACGGNYCKSNLCSPGAWCCPPGHSCNMSACGCS